MAAPAPADPTAKRPPLIKFKWFFPFAPWFILGFVALKHPNNWPPLEARILHLIGLAAYSIALLAVVQPWRSDDERVARR